MSFHLKRNTAEKKAYRAAKVAMYKRDGYRCRSCNASESLTPHHIVFQSQQGSDELDNLVTLCVECHHAVHDGFLRVVIVEVCSKFEGSFTVKFTRLKGWRPQCAS